MKRAFAALAVVFTLILSGCSAPTGLIEGSLVNVAEIGELTTLNPDSVSSEGGEQFASELANLTKLSFFSLDERGALVANKKFGKVRLVSSNPFVVDYSINKGIKWSDGQPVDAADLVMSYLAAKTEGFESKRQGSGLQYASIKKLGEYNLTLEFSEAVADWQSVLTVPVAAHSVSYFALEGIDSEAGKQAVISAVTGNDVPTIDKLGYAYRTAFLVDGNVPESQALVTNGAYSISKVTPRYSVSLQAAANFTAGPQANIEKLNLKLYQDATAAVSDMYNGTVDIIAAKESGLAKITDILSLVAALPSGTARSKVRASSSIDAVLINFGKGSVFADSTYSNHPERAHVLREALINLVPKTLLVQAANAEYVVAQADSFIYPSNSKFYSSVSTSNGSQDHLIQDVEKASELVESTDIRTPIDVRVVYDSTNPRSKSQFEELNSRSSSAGFNLIDVSSSDISETLDLGTFDVFIGSQPLTGVPGNSPSSLLAGFTGYADEEVSDLLSEYALAKTDVAKASVLGKVDARLYATNYGVPLIQVPNLVIYSTKLKSFTPSPFGDSATWGYWTWTVSGK